MIINPAFAQLEKKLNSLIASYVTAGNPGIALYVESEGKTVYKKAFGLDNSEGEKLDAATNFRMASVSKQFTAMCILLLEKNGKLSLEDPISRFFPEIPSIVGNKVLVRHLLTHSSGILDYESLMDQSKTTQLLDADVLNLLAQQDTTYFAPSSRFRYSNSAYALLALITERVSGQSFPHYMKTNIFKPLKMNKSVVYEASAKIDQRALGFARDQNKLFANDQSSTSAVKGDGGVYTSLNDYSRWTHALWKGTLLNLPPVLARLNFPIRDVTGSYYGPGWFYFEQQGQPALFHSGSTCGFSTFSINIPGKQTSIVYFSNIAGNTFPFKKILEVLAIEGIGIPSDVFQLHELTR